MTTCPHCHVQLPTVVDAFCPNCRTLLDDSPLPFEPQSAPTSSEPAEKDTTTSGRILGVLLNVLLPIGFNLLGLVFLLVFGLIAFILFELGPGSGTIVLGALVVVADLSLRKWWLRTSPMDLRRGGKALWMPIWIVGVFWMLLGLGRAISS